MVQTSQTTERRTSVDEIYDFLHQEIMTMRLLPGDKISEAEVAANFGVSRQPVRDAFSRLAINDLIVVRPQRATVVKRFSNREIVKSRFVRAAIEKDVLRLAASRCTAKEAKILDGEIKKQSECLDLGNVDRFGVLDYGFHKIICEIAGADFAFDVIQAEKSKVDRLCVLGLSKEIRMPELLQDHKDIASAIKANDAELAVKTGVVHLSRLDETIQRIKVNNANYFEPDT